MKENFVLYLPVAGPVQEGDLAFFTEKGELCVRKHGLPPTIAKNITGNHGKAARLFLCSRKIIAGDILRIRQYNGDPDWYARFREEDWPNHFSCEFLEPDKNDWIGRFGVMRSDAVKVIGEISRACNVKEGDEFNDDEYIISELPQCPLCEAPYNDGFCPNEQDCQIDLKRKVVIINGTDNNE